MLSSMRTKAVAAILVGALALPALAAPAAPAAPADAIRARINGYRELGAAFKAVNDGLRGSEVQTILIQQSARQIRNAAREQYAWFAPGSASAPGVKTYARPEIWRNAAEFKGLQDAFARQAEALQRAAATGNATTLRLEARKLGSTCKACHDKFRIEKD